MSEKQKVPEVFARYDDGLVVREMTLEETRYPMGWFNSLCPTSTDLQMAYKAHCPNPKGFYIGEKDGVPVASCIRIEVAPGIYYGSLFYVIPEQRGGGVGKKVRDDVGLRNVGDNSLAIDAHDDLEQMNHRRGYKTAYKVTLYTGVAEGFSQGHVLIKKVSEVSFDDVIKFDDQCFVRPRSRFRRKLLGQWTTVEGGLSLVALGDGGEIVGFGCRRPTMQEGNHIVGPLYAEGPGVAESLLAGLTKDIQGQNIWLTARDPHNEAVSLLTANGFKDEIHMIRMYLNGDPEPLSDKVYALTSIDVCGF